MPFEIEKLVFEALDDHFVRGFTCGNRSIDNFLLMDMAYLDQALGLSQTTLALYEGEVVGFYSARCTKIEIDLSEASSLGLNHLFVPAIEVPFLAVHKEYQRLGFIQTIGESSDFKTPMRMPIQQKTPFPEY